MDEAGRPHARAGTQVRPGVEAGDPSKANPARVYDALLGGKDNFAADRQVAGRLAAAKPALLANVRANRAFLGRATRHLAAEAGIRQFLDIGTGLPNLDNTHEVAQRVAPESRIVYVDNDPSVLAHARAILVSQPEGETSYLHADLRDPEAILTQAAQTLDFEKPVAVMLLGILYMIPDTDEPYPIVARLMEAVAPGSYLVISHPASDVDPDAAAEAARQYDSMLPTSQTNRTRAQVMRFFEGLRLLEPGVVPLNRWRPDANDREPRIEISSWGGLAQKM
jgi:S-adenosyl methyltransferase